MKLPTRQGQMGVLGVCVDGRALELEDYHAYYPPCQILSPNQDDREGQGQVSKQGVQWARQAERGWCTLGGEDTQGVGTHLLSLYLLSKIGSPLKPHLPPPHCLDG